MRDLERWVSHAIGSPADDSEQPAGMAVHGAPERIAAQVSGGSASTCDGQYAVDFNAYAATQTADPLLVAGAAVDLQAWFRDPPSPGGANLTNAGTFILGPWPKLTSRPAPR